MKYKAGFKYQLHEDLIISTFMMPDQPILTQYLEMTSKGILTIKVGYAWDGPSGPTIDTQNFMRGSLLHDALYQLMREGLLSMRWRKPADRLLQKTCIKDGMSKFRAWYVYRGLQWAQGKAALPENKKEILEAP